MSISAKDCERLCTNFRACCSANGKLWNRLNISLRKVELGYKALLDIDGPGPDDQEMMEEAMLERDGAAGASRGSRVCPEFCGATGFPPSWRQGMHVSSSLYDMATDDAQRHADTFFECGSSTNVCEWPNVKLTYDDITLFFGEVDQCETKSSSLSTSNSGAISPSSCIHIFSRVLWAGVYIFSNVLYIVT